MNYQSAGLLTTVLDITAYLVFFSQRRKVRKETIFS